MDRPHPAKDLPLDERLDYLTVLAAVVAADGKVDDREISRLLALVRALGVPNADISVVLDSAEKPATDRVRAALRRLNDSDLRFTLMIELIFMAHVDDDLDEAESQELSSVAEALGINSEQRTAMAEYVIGIRRAQRFAEGSTRVWKSLGGKVARRLRDRGVPGPAVSVSTDLFAAQGEPPSPGLSAMKVGFNAVYGDVDGALVGLQASDGYRWFCREVVEA